MERLSLKKSQFWGLHVKTVGRTTNEMPSNRLSEGHTLKQAQSWLVFINLIPTRVTWEEEASVEDLPPSDWPVGTSVGLLD